MWCEAPSRFFQRAQHPNATHAHKNTNINK
jgi:histone H3